MADGRRSSRFLVVAYGIQGHLNPARSLARRLAGIHGVTAVLSVPLFAHRRMFPSASDEGDAMVSDGVISYAPFSDGLDDGSWPTGSGEDKARRRRASVESLSAVARRLAATCVVCTLNMPAVVEAARAHALPLAVYWIQPATALLAYYHFFHGHAAAILAAAIGPAAPAVTLPGLSRALRARDMPSFFFTGDDSGDELSKMILQGFRELFELMDEEKEKKTPFMVLVNTLEALEETALRAIRPYLGDDVFAVGAPVLAGAREEEEEEPAGAGGETIHLFAQEEGKRYMAWLDAQPAKSVVYVSSGSLLTYSARQAEELLLGLRRLGRPYLWVVRRDGRSPELESLLEAAAVEEAKGMVVEWCDQKAVLAHPSVACFVTHCGWSSTLETMTLGVPAVAAPTWSDQPMNAHLLAEEWGVGVRAERDADGVLTGDKLARCVEMALDDGKATANAGAWKEKARQAVAVDGPSERSLRRFVSRVQELSGANL